MAEGAYKNDVFTRVRGWDTRAVALALLLLACVVAPLVAFGAPGGLGSPDLETRLAAIKAAGEGGDASQAPRLAAALGSEKNPLAREYLVTALGRLKDARAVPALLDAAAKDPDLGVRTGAVAALNQIGDAGAVKELEKLAADPAQPASVRRGCLIVAAARRREGSLKTLAAAAGDKDPAVRQAAVEALGLVEGAEARAALDKAAADPDPAVSAAARRVIEGRKKAAAPGKAARGGKP